jgi:GntR family transcriptional regulator of arabinose operon
MKAPNEKIIDYLKSELFKTYFPGDKIPSETQLSQMFGVSRLTVRKAIQKLVNQDILVSVQGLGTFITEYAGSPKNNQKKVLAIFPSSYTTSRNWRIAIGIFSTIDKFNITPVMINVVLEDEKIYKKQIKTAWNQDFSGLIILPYPEIIQLPEIQNLIEKNFPIIFVDRYLNGYKIPSVVSDSFKCACQMGKHLKKYHNVEKPIFVSEEDLVIGSVKDRYEGFKKGFNSPVDILITPEHSEVDVLAEKIKKGKYDCVAFCHDNLALRGLTVFQREGIKIPGDLKVVGFDDKSASRYSSPTITTAGQNFQEIGETAALMMAKLLRKEKIPQISTVPMEIIIRESCGCNGK